MKQLIYSSKRPDGRIENHWRHFGDDGREKLTVEVVEDVEPVLDQNKRDYADAPSRFGRGAFHRLASFPPTVISEFARLTAIRWGVSTCQAYSELSCNDELGQLGKTDRAKATWRFILNARDLRDFRCRPGRV